MREQLLRAISRANDDPEFKIAARKWDADVEFSSNAEAVRMCVRDGRVADGAASSEPGIGVIRISGSPDGWSKMLEPAPRPFYQDLFGAAMHHGFVIDGRIEDVGPYYAAIRRLLDIAREEGR